MKSILAIFCLSLSFGLCAESDSDNYESIRDNAADTHEEHELGERDYPNMMTSYRECRDAYRYAVRVPKLPPTEIVAGK